MSQPPRPRVVLATRNRHKVREIAELLAPVGLDLIGIDDVAADLPLKEDEDTFEGNALSKAHQAGASTGLPTLADDSGLEVDTLGGAPGVHSARYAGEPCDDARNNAKLLSALSGVPDGERSARYRCVAAFFDPATGRTSTAAGACEGLILQAPRGDGGFGYDPLFLVPSLGKTMAEIDLAEKNRLSHRAAAFRRLAEVLPGLLSASAPTR
jgi:XTP/dITP diphosphohydrolase